MQLAGYSWCAADLRRQGLRETAEAAPNNVVERSQAESGAIVSMIARQMRRDAAWSSAQRRSYP